MTRLLRRSIRGLFLAALLVGGRTPAHCAPPALLSASSAADLMELGLPLTAKKQYLSLPPEARGSSPLLPDLLRRLAGAGYAEEALALLEEVRPHLSEAVRAQAMLAAGKVHWERNDREKAEQAFGQVSGRSPAAAEAALYLGRFLAADGRVPEALRALSASPPGGRAGLIAGAAEMVRNNRTGAVAAWSEVQRDGTSAGFLARLLALAHGEAQASAARELQAIADTPGAALPDRAASLESLAGVLLAGQDPAGALSAAKAGIGVVGRWKEAAAKPQAGNGTGAGARESWKALVSLFPWDEDARRFFTSGRRLLAYGALGETALALENGIRQTSRRIRTARHALALAQDDVARGIRRAQEIRSRGAEEQRKAAGMRKRLTDAADTMRLSEWGARTDPRNAALLREADARMQELKGRLPGMVSTYDAKIRKQWSPPVSPEDRIMIMLAQSRLDRTRTRFRPLEGRLAFLRGKVWNRWKAEYTARLSALLDRAEEAGPRAERLAARAQAVGSRLADASAQIEAWAGSLDRLSARLAGHAAVLSRRRAHARAAADRELDDARRELQAALSRKDRSMHYLAGRAATEMAVAGGTPANGGTALLLRQRKEMLREAAAHWEAALPPPGERSPFADEALYALAELRYEGAEMEFFGGKDPGGGAPDYSAALGLFRKVVRQFPDSPYAEPARYGMALCFQEMGDDESALAAMKALLARHPRTRYAAEVRVRLGEDAFDRDDFTAAEQYYRKIGNDAPPELRATALFKLGWSLLRQERPGEAAEAFLSALRLSPDARKTGGVDEESLNMLGRSLVDAGMESGAEAFLARHGAQAHGPATLLAIQVILDTQNRYDDAALVADRLGRAYPLAPERVDAEVAAAEALRKGNRVPDSQGRRWRFCEVFGPGSRWQAAARRPAAELARADAICEEGLRGAVFYFHARSREAAPGDRPAVLAGYDVYLSRFSSSENAGEVAYGRAWLLFEAAKKREAARAFEEAARFGGARAEPARYMALQAAKDASSPADADAQAEVVRLAREYERAHPAGGRIPQVLLDRSRAHANLRRFREAAEAAGQASILLPPGEDRLAALRLAGDARFELEEYADAELAFRALLAASRKADLTADAQKWAGFSLFRRAETLAAERPAEAAVLFTQVAREFPTLEIAPVALFRAGASLVDAGRTREAVSAFLAVEANRSNPSLSLDATRSLAGLFETAGDNVAAAERYERLATEEGEGEKRRKHLLRAADLFHGKDGRRARQNLLAVASMADTPAVLRISCLFRAAESARDEGRLDEADKRYREVVSAHRAAPDAAPRTAGKALFRRAEHRFAEFLRLGISPPLDKTFAAKQAALEGAAPLYLEAIRLGDAETVSASLHRLGEGFEEFRNAVLASPPPRGLSPREREEYTFLLEEKGAPIEEKAVDAYLKNLRQAVAAEFFSPWVGKSLARLRALRPARFARRWEYTFPVVTVPEFRGIVARRFADEVPDETSRLWRAIAPRFLSETGDRDVPSIAAVPGADPRNAALSRNIEAFVHYRQGNPAAAETTLAAVLGEGAVAAELATNLGLVQAELGKWKEARANLERAVRETPQMPKAWLNLGVFREVYQGDSEGARDCYEKYLANMGERNEEVQRWVEWLGGYAPQQH